MASIVARPRKSGTVYQAKIRIKRDGKIVWQESETFSKRALAKEWAARREVELRAPGVLERLTHVGLTIRTVLEWYLEDFDGATQFGRTKLSHINFLMGQPIADLDAIALTSRQVLAHLRERRQTASAATVNNDVIWLSNAFRSARVDRGAPVNSQALDDAAYLARKERLIGKSKERNRRPTMDELERLVRYFQAQRRNKIPMVDIIGFAIFSTRRQEEICEIRRSDMTNGGVWVRDMKHPTEKKDTFVFLPERAQAIADRQPAGDVVFPYNSKSVSAAFTKACRYLGIEDLRFHDLRHEGISYQFELGKQIPEVAMISGHRSWASLKRYAHIREMEDRYANCELFSHCS